ncbi:MAG TPA: dihydrofolate reductase family protein [Chloroflexota bacterium]|nr:dihydrofolate reductase family protein [Chloroflexota bacterium]
MEQLFPPSPQPLALEDVYRDLTFPEPPEDRPYTLLNFVSTVDGQTTLGDTGASQIGSAVDHRLMKRLRAAVDGLLHGAGTVRLDNFRPIVPVDLVGERLARGLAEQPLGVVVTASGNLEPSLRYFSGRPPVVLTRESREAALQACLGGHATVVGVGGDAVDLRAAMGVLRRRFAVRTLLCEGGPKLAHGLIAAGLADELFLTLAPKVGSDSGALRLLDGPRFVPPDVPELSLTHVLHHEGELFLRYILPTGQR